jgi:glucose-6-phosphate 1-epimerase
VRLSFSSTLSSRGLAGWLLMSMGHYTNLTDPRTELEVVRDWNGVDQVVLRSPRGAYARVSRFLRMDFDRLGIESFGLVWCDSDGFVFFVVVCVLQVSLHGGQVLSWRNDRGEELLFTSSKVTFFFFSIHFSILQCSATGFTLLRLA